MRSLAAITVMALILSGASGIFGASGASGAAAPAVEDRDVLFQVSTIDALLQAVYDGFFPFGELKSHGDLGIGTFEGIEGEMIALDGEYYQVKSDGNAYPVSDGAMTPFSSVTFFDADLTVPVKNASNLTLLGEQIDSALPSRNIFYAIRIDGTFPYVKTRSIPKQERPYPRLVDASKNQSVFEFNNSTGTLVGFWTPEFAAGMNMPGYHVHFITEDRKAGGHVLDLEISEADVLIDVTPGFFMALPTEGDFYSVDLTQDLQEELEQVEK